MPGAACRVRPRQAPELTELLTDVRLVDAGRAAANRAESVGVSGDGFGDALQ